MHAFRCALLLVSLVFGEVFFAGSASLHDWFLYFLESAFSVTCLGAFFLGDGMKGFGVWIVLCLCTRMYMWGVLLCIKKCCDV